MARKALEKFIGLGSALSRAAMRSMFCCLRSAIASSHWRLGLICPGLRAALKAERADLMSPTTGAAMGRLLSISTGEMSTCTKRAPSGHIGVADRVGAGGGGGLRMGVGQQALGHRHRQERHAARLDE